MLGLPSLPYEVLSNIVTHISFEDVFALAQTCRNFHFLLTEESIAKLVMQDKIPHSQEAVLAKKKGTGHARALRQATKRRLAVSTANPFIVATIGLCDAYLYSKGMLCYILDDKIRVLNLHRSAGEEMVISIPGLITHALPDIGDSKGVFQLLYYSDGIVSCLYKSSVPSPTAWLISFHLRSRTVLVAYELESTSKIFVRHNHQFLYFGTHSELGADGYKRWVVQGYEIAKRKWFPEKVHFPDLVGSEIGSTICFEFYNGFFYALSNQTSFEVEEIDWTSFYHCLRFPLNSPCKALLEKTDNNSMWRRQHQEGPIDDRWTSLRLFKDESTGALRIIEARKEWYLGSSKSQRTYYSTDIIFPEPLKDDDTVMDYAQYASASNNDVPITHGGGSATEVASSSSAPSSTTAPTSRTISTSTSLAPPSGISRFPDPQLALLIDRKEDNPHYFDAYARCPHSTHPGNDGSSCTFPTKTHTLAKSRMRTYFTSCSTFMDLVEDPLASDWTGQQRLRLRAGTRTLGPVLRDPETDLLIDAPEDVDLALKKLYRVSEVRYWPPEQQEGEVDENLNQIYKILNPPSHLGDVEGTADERSLIYMTGPTTGPRALIFVGFDPSIKLMGFKEWGGVQNKDNRGATDVDEANRSATTDVKGKGKEVVRGLQSDCAPVGTGGHAVVDFHDGGRGRGIQHARWAWKEPAMYRDIDRGFYFGRNPFSDDRDDRGCS